MTPEPNHRNKIDFDAVDAYENKRRQVRNLAHLKGIQPEPTLTVQEVVIILTVALLLTVVAPTLEAWLN
jgi:hypothetical protein